MKLSHKRISPEHTRPLCLKVTGTQAQGYQTVWFTGFSGLGRLLSVPHRCILKPGTPAVCILALSRCQKGTCTPYDRLQEEQIVLGAFVLEPLVVCLSASWSVKFKARLSFTTGWGGHTLGKIRYMKAVCLQMLNCFTTLLRQRNN